MVSLNYVIKCFRPSVVEQSKRTNSCIDWYVHKYVSDPQWRTQEFFSEKGSTNSVEDRGQTERGSGCVAPYSGVLEAAVIWYNKFHFI